MTLTSLTDSTLCNTASISSFFSLPSLIFLFANRAIDANNVAPPIVQPTGPAIAKNAVPDAIPPPPAAAAPPPSHAKAALVAAAPDSVDIAVPVEAVPNVVATHIAALGAKLATAIPPATPAPTPAMDFLAASSSCVA